MKNINSVLFGLVFVLTSIGSLPNISFAQVNIANNNVNNNVNNNINTNNMPAQQVYQPHVVYTQSSSGYYYDNYSTPDSNATYTYSNPYNYSYSSARASSVDTDDSGEVCTTCSRVAYRLVNKKQCGAVVEVGDDQLPKPVCSLVPAITPSGAIELQWTTIGATVAFIDSGIGHVNTVSGSRIVTPTKDTAYNMTVLNDAGITGTCGAIVKVKVEVDPISTSTDPTATSTDPTNGSGSGGLFGEAFKKIAIPVGVVFLVLIILLIFIMSKVKSSK